ncbi:MAG TPA: ABC transporter ATP-binding protein [Casimicrobiaceae bacterium]
MTIAAQTTPMPYLDIQHVSAAYGATKVLDDVSLSVEKGELIALLGSSGCGKTTLLRSIAGFVTPTAGRIVIDGRDLTGLPPEVRGTAMMFQSYALWPHLDVAANIGYGLRMRGWKKPAITARVGEMLKLMQLDGYEARSIAQLSGGQRQRIALGRALAVDPSVLLLDEPMSNLDYKVRIELRHELRALQKRVGITAVYVTHDREEALTLADRIAVIDAGKIAQLGTPEEIFHHPASAFVAGFMGADNSLAVVRAGDGWAVADDAFAPMRAHFRGDRARVVDSSDPAVADTLHFDGTVTQRIYLGNGFRYRIRTTRDEVWVDDDAPHAEGAAVRVAVAPNALLLFEQGRETDRRTAVPTAKHHH